MIPSVTALLRGKIYLTTSLVWQYQETHYPREAPPQPRLSSIQSSVLDLKVSYLLNKKA
jgi:hypothetical protein